MRVKLLRKLRSEANSTYKIRVDGYHTPMFKVIAHHKKYTEEVATFPYMMEAVTTLKHYRNTYMQQRIADMRYNKVLKRFK
jgi:hypothetical protein